MKTKLLFLLSLFTLHFFAQDGLIDSAFDPGASANNSISSLQERADGKIAITGLFTTYQGQPRVGVALLNSDGTIDNSFVPFSNSLGVYVVYYQIKFQPDNKLIIYGEENGVKVIRRLMPDGSIDSSFSATINNNITELFIDTDGKIILTGNFTNVSGVPRNGIVRLHTTGNVDATFYPGTGVSGGNFIYAIGKQSNGKYVLGGYVVNYDGYSVNNFLRINNDGSFDNTFQSGIGASGTISSVSILSDDKIIISGALTFYDGATANKIARLNANGTRDNSFVGSIGATPVEIVKHTLLSDKQIVVYCSSMMTFAGAIDRNKIAVLNTRGSLNPDFNPGGSFRYSPDLASTNIGEVIGTLSGKIMACGLWDSYSAGPNINLVRIQNKTVNAPNSNCYQVVDRITSSSAFNPNGREFINGFSSQCALPKSYPGQGEFNIYYNTHSFTNWSSVTQCVTFELRNQATNNGSGVGLSLYNTTFNPANLSQNYLGGTGGFSSNLFAKKCAIQVPPGQTVVALIYESDSFFNTANGDYILSVDGFCNSPTVTVKAMPSMDYNPQKPVVYYNVKFNMPIIGFTNSDLVVNTSIPGVQAFIKETGISNNKDFIVGLTGMQNSGLIDFSIPAGAVISPDEGTGNLKSIHFSDYWNYSQTYYVLPTVSCTKQASEGVLQNVLTYNMYNTPSAYCDFITNFNLLNGTFSNKIHTIINTSGINKCIGFRIKKAGASSYHFNVYKNALPTNNASALANWIGGSDNAISTFGGYTTQVGYAYVESGQTFFVEVITNNNDYELIMEDVSCGEVLATADFDEPNKMISVYPNPSNGVFVISSDKKIDTVTIYNSLGQKVYYGNQSKIDISNNSKGIYFVEITSDRQTTTQKIILN